MAPPTKLTRNHRKFKPKNPLLKRTRKIRPSITPGTVLILLRGVHAGRRVVYVKSVMNGRMLMVTGPQKINGVPFTTVNQSSVIATSTKIDLKGAVTKGIDTGLFKRTVRNAAKKSEDMFFNKRKPTEERRSAQNLLAKAVDLHVIQEIKKVPLLKAYLRQCFSLKRNERPHMMKF